MRKMKKVILGILSLKVSNVMNVNLCMFELVWLTLLEHLKMKILQVDKVKNGLPAYRIIL